MYNDTGGDNENRCDDMRPVFSPSVRNPNCGSQAGYFDKDFLRLFEGEDMNRKEAIPEPSHPAFLMGTCQHSTSQDLYGTFDKFECPSGLTRPVPHGSPGKDFMATQGKKGGPGYADICINRYPAHDCDRYGLKLKSKSYGEDLNGPFISACYPKRYFTDATNDRSAEPDHLKNNGPQFLRGHWAVMYPEKWHGTGCGGYFSILPRTISLENMHQW